jgi:hypothetical protein
MHGQQNSITFFQTQQLVPQQQTMAYYNNANTAINNAAAVTAGTVPPQQHPQSQPQQQQQPPQLTAASVTPHQQMPAPPPTVLPAPHVTAAVVNGTAHPEEVMSASIPMTVMPPSVNATPTIPQQAAMLPTQTPIQSMQPIPQAQIPLQQPAAPSVPPPGHHALIKHEAEEVEQDNAVEDDNEEEQEGADDHEVVDEESESPAKQEMEDTHQHSESGEKCLFLVRLCGLKDTALIRYTVSYPGIFFGWGSTNSVEDRGQRE